MVEFEADHPAIKTRLAAPATTMSTTAAMKAATTAEAGPAARFKPARITPARNSAKGAWTLTAAVKHRSPSPTTAAKRLTSS
ncbi:MAG: hypothetical protein WBC78_17745, partial [Candidatus Sulfotelmatobacter sp.]